MRILCDPSSNAAMDIYPDNKIAHSTNKFAKPISLKGEWEVSLSEVQQLHSLCSLFNYACVFHVHLMDGVRKLESYVCHTTQAYYKKMEITYNSMKNKICIMAQKHICSRLPETWCILYAQYES